MNFVDSGIEVFILDAKTEDLKAIFEWNSGLFTILSLKIPHSLLVRRLHRLQEEKSASIECGTEMYNYFFPLCVADIFSVVVRFRDSNDDVSLTMCETE